MTNSQPERSLSASSASVRSPSSGVVHTRLADDAFLEQAVALMFELAAGGRNEITGTMAREHLETGGKRLRARLALAACEALSVPRGHAVEWAAACELVHNATLVHDDLQDRDERRRGEPTVWVRHGDAHAINVGDLLFMLPFLAVGRSAHASAEQRSLLMHAIAELTSEVVRGQALEYELGKAETVSWADYKTAVTGKTSALFELPVLGAALLAGYDGARAARLAEPFGLLGVVFQMQDDVLDLYGDKGRGLPGSDLYEGKVSCLVVEHWSLHPAERSQVQQLLRLPRSETPSERVTELIRKFKEGGALAGVIARIHQLSHEMTEHPDLAAAPELKALAVELLELLLAPIRHVL